MATMGAFLVLEAAYMYPPGRWLRYSFFTLRFPCGLMGDGDDSLVPSIVLLLLVFLVLRVACISGGASGGYHAIKRSQVLRKETMPKQVKGTTEGTSDPMLEPDELRSLEGIDFIEYDISTLGVDDDGTDQDEQAYLNLVEDLGMACTGSENRLERSSTIEGIHRTISDAKHKACVVHAAGDFEGDSVDGLLMFIKQTIYVQAVDQEVYGWHEVTDTELPIRGAGLLNCSGSYIDIRSLRLGLKEFKRAIVRLIKGTSTDLDISTVAVNLCEAVRYRYFAEKVVSTIVGVNKEIFDVRESCSICDTCDLLIDSWGKLSTSIDNYLEDKVWKCHAENNKNEEDKILTKEFVIQWVRIVKIPSKKKKQKNQEKRGKSRKAV